MLCAGRLWDAAKNAQALAAVAPLLAWPVCIAGEVMAPDGGRAEIAGANLHLLGSLSPARSLPPGMRAPPSMPCRRATSPSA